MLENTIRQYAVFHHIECFFFKELISCVEIVPCTSYCSSGYTNIRVSPMKNEGVFCCYCSGRNDGFGENGGDVSTNTLKIDINEISDQLEMCKNIISV